MVTYASHGIIPHLLLDVAIKERVWTLEYLEINVANKQVHYFAIIPVPIIILDDSAGNTDINNFPDPENPQTLKLD